jgi:hypothetical protein
MMFPEYAWVNAPHLYLNYDGFILIRVCTKCGRFVKADEVISIGDCGPNATMENATCKKCGRVWMTEVGWD